MKRRRTILATTLLTLAVAACDDLPPGDVTDPNYWGDAFLKKYQDELVIGQLEPGPKPLDKPRVVLLITGVTIPAEWFQPIEARLKRDGFIPVVYEPPELLSGDLAQNTKWLGDVVEKVKADYQQDTIDILAECTGGVIARHYIQSLGGAKNVARMVTFISPQHGVAKAPWAAAIAGWPALHDLTPGSKFLNAVNGAPLPSDVSFTSIYSCTDEYIQPYQSSIIPGAKNIGLCNEFVGHFEFFYNPDIYLIMHDALVAPAPKDPAQIPGDNSAGGAAGAAGNDPGTSDAGAGGASSDDDPLDGDPNDATPADPPGAGAEPEAGCSMSGPAPGTGGAWLALGGVAFALSRRRRAE